MSPRRVAKNSTWYKEHYEKIALLLVLIGLLLSSVLLLYQTGRARRALSEISTWEVMDSQGKVYKKLDLSQYEPFQEALEKPFRIAARTNLFMVSELRVASVNPDVVTPIRYDATVCPWTGYPQPSITERDSTGDGIPDQWLIDHGLDPFDKAVGDSDPDQDGFTVMEEFLAGTNPVDAESHPSYGIKLRVRRIVDRPFGLRFMGTSEPSPGDVRYLLNMTSQARSHFARMGDEIQGFKLIGYEPQTRPGPLGPVDASVLVLDRAGKRIRLVVNQDYREQDRVAELIFLVDESTYRVEPGEDVTVGGYQFKVIDIAADHVIIRDEKRAENIRIEMLAPSDLAPVPGTMSDDSSFPFFYDETAGQAGGTR